MAQPPQAKKSTLNNHIIMRTQKQTMAGPGPGLLLVAALIGVPEAADDPRFSSMQPRMLNCADCVALLDGVFATRPRDEWVRRLTEGGDFIFSIVNAVDDLPDDPQVRANDYVTTFDHPAFGPTHVVGVPVRLSETPGQIRLPAPEFGQHTEEVLIGLLGYSWDAVARLRAAEVI